VKTFAVGFHKTHYSKIPDILALFNISPWCKFGH